MLAGPAAACAEMDAVELGNLQWARMGMDTHEAISRGSSDIVLIPLSQLSDQQNQQFQCDSYAFLREVESRSKVSEGYMHRWNDDFRTAFGRL